MAFFIGASDYNFENSFRWIETGLSIGSFNKWAVGQPDGDKVENCMLLSWDGTDLVWVDEHCNPYRVTEAPPMVTPGPTPANNHHHSHQHTITKGFHNYICEKL